MMEFLVIIYNITYHIETIDVATRCPVIPIQSHNIFLLPFLPSWSCLGFYEIAFLGGSL